MNPPSISIVTPSYNQAAYLEGTLRSVLEQDYPKLEFIVIDGGSTDGSIEIIRKYAKHLSYWVSEPDRGQSHAINKGLSRSTGEIWAWVNSDDRLLPGALERVAEAWAVGKPDDVAWVGGCRRVLADGMLLNEIWPKNLVVEEVADWLVNNFYQPAVFMRRSAVEQAMGLDEKLDYCMDLHLWIKLARLGRLQKVPHLLAEATIQADAKTQAGRPEAMAETGVLLTEEGYPEQAKRYLAAHLRRAMTKAAQAHHPNFAGRIREALRRVKRRVC